MFRDRLDHVLAVICKVKEATTLPAGAKLAQTRELSQDQVAQEVLGADRMHVIGDAKVAPDFIEDLRGVVGELVHVDLIAGPLRDNVVHVFAFEVAGDERHLNGLERADGDAHADHHIEDEVPVFVAEVDRLLFLLEVGHSGSAVVVGVVHLPVELHPRETVVFD